MRCAGLGFCEISYEILFGIVRDFVQDIVWDFARSCTSFCVLNTMTVNVY